MNERENKIKIEMVIHNDTKTSLAKKLGMGRYTLTRKIKGVYDWKISELEKLAEIYEKDKTYFF